MKKTLLILTLLLLVGVLFIPTLRNQAKANGSQTVECYDFAAPIDPFAITDGASLHSASGEDDSQDPVILLAAGTVLILVCSLATFNQQRIKRLREEKVDREERK